MVAGLNPDITTIGTQTFTVDGRTFTLQVVDPVLDYMGYMGEIFDFGAIKGLLTGTGGYAKLEVLMNSLNGGRS